MERNLRRQKNPKYPSKPVTASQIKQAYEDKAIKVDFGLNLAKTQEFYIDTVETEVNSAFTLFASHQVINLIEENIPAAERRYLIDGTFDACPVGCYYQLLIIVIEYKNDVSQYSKSINYRRSSILKFKFHIEQVPLNASFKHRSC